MRDLTLGDLAARLGGTLTGQPTTRVTGVVLDSRDSKPGVLFVAIKGAKTDGHDHVQDAVALGAVAALVERPVPGPTILVESVVEALARLGRSLRSEFVGPVIGITGSNGKTTTKELTAAALSTLGPTLKSGGNRNTEFTSPLVWLDLEPKHKAAVIEMGMRGFGQIAHLAAISRPTVGVVTCIGTAHAEMVGSRTGIARAKGELLQALPAEGTAVLWQEDDFLIDLRAMARCPVRTFGFSPEAECRVVGYRALDWSSSSIRLTLSRESAEVTLPVLGRHQALNAAAAALAAVSAGANFQEAVAALAKVDLPPMRLEIRHFGDLTVIVDTYNASPDSAIAAINALVEIPCTGRKLAVLGEMKELGAFEESGHRLVGRALASSLIDRVLLTGGPTHYIYEEAIRSGFPAERIETLDQPDIERIRLFLLSASPGDVALIKASRALGLERAIDGMEATKP